MGSSAPGHLSRLFTLSFAVSLAEQTQTLVFEDSYVLQDIPVCDPYRSVVVRSEFEGE